MQCTEMAYPLAKSHASGDGVQLTDGACFNQCFSLDQAQSSSATADDDNFVLHAELREQVRRGGRSRGAIGGLHRDRLESGRHCLMSSGSQGRVCLTATMTEGQAGGLGGTDQGMLNEC